MPAEGLAYRRRGGNGYLPILAPITLDKVGGF
jgi:hypothetical protein